MKKIELFCVTNLEMGFLENLGLNLAGVELSLGMFNQMLKMKSGLDQAENGELKRYLEDCLNEMFKILKTRPS